MVCFKWPTKFCTTLHGIGYLLNVQCRDETAWSRMRRRETGSVHLQLVLIVETSRVTRITYYKGVSVEMHPSFTASGNDKYLLVRRFLKVRFKYK